MTLPLILPDWPAPKTVHALITTRQGGVSLPPWDTLNLGTHVDDNPADVAENRRRLALATGLDAGKISWLRQVHGTGVVTLPVTPDAEADGSTATGAGLVCAILTADCLPVLFCDRAGRRVAAAHAGWRGLADGVLERTAAVFDRPDEVMAFLGPAIGPAAFEVGAEVRDAFVAGDPAAEAAFRPSQRKPETYMADIYTLARQRLVRAGVSAVYGGGLCTVSDPDRFFSYRRDGLTGRMAALIWLS